LGGAESCTGHAIASPVTLRQEGIAMPKDHMNFGDVFPDDNKKGKGKGGKDGKTVTPEEAQAAKEARKFAPPVPKGAPAVPKLPENASAADYARAVAAANAAKSPEEKEWEAIEEAAALEAAKFAAEEAKALLKRQKAAFAKPKIVIESTKPVAHDGLSVIERRRQAMAASQAAAPDEAVNEDEAEAEGDGDAAEADDDGNDEAFRLQLAELQAVQAKADREAAAKRAREEAMAKEPPAKKPKATGLQAWAERVNNSAGEDADLATLCREFVRKRIMKAHGAGNLHTNDWEEEPLPTPEELGVEEAAAE